MDTRTNTPAMNKAELVEAVQKNLGATFGNPRTDGENMEAAEGPLGRV